MAKERYTERNRTRRPKKEEPRFSVKARILTATSLALALGAGVINQARKSPDATPVTTTPLLTPAPNESGISMLMDEKTIDSLIGNLDKGMGNLFETLKAKLTHATPKERAYMLAPFEFYFKNAQTRERNSIRATGSTALPAVDPQNTSSGYFINGLSGDPSIIAAYAPQYQSLLIRPPFNAENVYDISIAAHELQHTWQHEQRMNGAVPIDHESYVRYLYTLGTNNILGPDEAEAYAFQINILNALTDGDLKRDVLSGSISLPDWRARLKAQPSQDHHFRNLLGMADNLFTYQEDVTIVPAEFQSSLYAFMGESGNTVYAFDAQGMVVPVKAPDE